MALGNVNEKHGQTREKVSSQLKK